MRRFVANVSERERADKEIQDGRASGHQESGATWLDYYR